jgi:hypothetical protein
VLLDEDEDDDEDAEAGVEVEGEEVAGVEGVLDGALEPDEPDDPAPEDSDVEAVDAAAEVLDDAPRLSFL